MTMYTPAALLDLHERTHRGFRKLLDHCADFSSDELAREMDGFGYPAIRLQLHHMIGAEEYWIGVLRGLMLIDEREEDFASMEALRSYRDRTARVTVEYLRRVTDEDLNTRRPMTTWGDQQVELLPAHVVLRTQTHIFQHQGQVAVMARLLGRPVPQGLDFPIR